MATVQQLIDEAHRVITESQEGGNTQSRIGNLYLGIIDFIDILDKRTIDGYEYDDTELKNAIRRVDEAIETLDRSIDDALVIVNQEKDRLDNLVDGLDRDIENKVNRMLDDASTLEGHAATIQELVNEGKIYWKSEWDDNIEAYLQEVGVWARKGDVIRTQWSEIKQDVASIQSTVAEVQTDLNGRPTSTQWSQITQKVNSIEQSVNSLVYDGDVTEALQSSINQSIEDGIAKLSLETTYAQTKDMGDAEEVIRWMYSALRNSASSEQTYAEIVAAGKDGLNNAIADMRTCVTTITNGDYLQYVSEASMETKVNEVITGLYSKATSEESFTNIFSQVNKSRNDISEITIHCTGDYSDLSIATKFEKFRAGLVVHSDLESARAELTAHVDSEIANSTAGLINEATLNTATSEMYAEMNRKFAGVIAYADLEKAFVEMVASTTDVDDGPIASIVAAINGGKSSIQLTADTINIDGLVPKITANQAFIGYLSGGSATFKGSIEATSLTLGTNVTISQDDVDGLTNALNNKANTSDIPTKLSQLTDNVGIVKNSDVTIGNITTDDNGVQSRKITVGTKEYTEIVNKDFILFGRSKGKDEEGQNYFKIDTNGLLKARNALIYGTIYATDGVFQGTIKATSLELGTGVTIKQSDVAGLDTKLTSIDTAIAAKADPSDIPQDIDDLLPEGVTVITSNDVKITALPTVNGIKSQKITIGETEYTEIINDDFVIFGQSKGTDSANNKYFKIDSDGLLKARNAIIYGTIYAGGGEIAGWSIGTNAITSSNSNVGMYSGGSADTDVRFWAGGSRTSAPFRVTQGGELYASNANISGSFSIKSDSTTVLTIDGNSTSTSATEDLTILDSQGLYIKRGNEGFRLTASGGFQRFNSSQNSLVPFYAGRCVRRVDIQSDSINIDDDFIISMSGNSALFLPEGVDGKVITIKAIGGVRIYPGSNQQIITDHAVTEDYQPLDSYERAEFVFYQGSWYWNKIGI